MNNKIITSLTMCSLLNIMVIPSNVYGGAGTSQDYYWKTDPVICYQTTSLDNLSVDGSTSSGTSFETEFDKAVSMFNDAFSSTTTIGADSSSSCNASYVINVYSDTFTDTNALGYEASYTESTDSYAFMQSDISFNTSVNWKTTGTTCSAFSTSSALIEYVANHELGHGVGLKHHVHTTVNSMMHTTCTPSTFDAIQTVDQTALDVNYPAST